MIATEYVQILKIVKRLHCRESGLVRKSEIIAIKEIPTYILRYMCDHHSKRQYIIWQLSVSEYDMYR